MIVGTAIAVLLAAAVAFWFGCFVTGYRAVPGNTAALVRENLLRLLRTAAIATFCVLFLGAACFYVLRWDVTRLNVAQLLLVGLSAGAVGYGELVSRYRDDPRRLLAAQATALYIAVNITAGIAALALVKLLGVLDGHAHRTLYEVLLAAFGAIAFFRTSLFTARIGGTDVGIGPSTLLKSLLDASDLLINRGQATRRADDVAPIMNGVDFQKAKTTLPTLCMTLVEGFPDDQRKQLGDQIAQLDSDTTIEPTAKTTILGAYLIRQFGIDVLASAVATLGNRIN